MTTKTDICNLALDLLAIDQKIGDVDAAADRSKETTAMRRWYDQCRDELLGSYPWTFATKAQALALSADVPLPGWSYSYAYPSDCVNALEVTTEAGSRLSFSYADQSPFLIESPYYGQRSPWRVSMSSDGASQRIQTDVASAFVVYVARATNAAIYPEIFISVFAMRLAAATGIVLKVDPSIARAAVENFMAWEVRARAFVQNQGQPDPRRESPSISVRG